MKIVCDACQAKYSIADDKIQGKAFKIRCKKCNHIIVVKTVGEGAASPARVAAVSEKPKVAAQVVDQAAWHVVVDGDQVGPLMESELRDRIRQGKIDSETLVWKEGFADWTQLSAVPELTAILARTTHHPVAKPAGREPMPREPARVSSSMRAVAAQSEAAEMESLEAPTVISPPGTADLFASAMGSPATPVAVAPAPSSPFLFGGAPAQTTEPMVAKPPGNGAGSTQLTGQRNENSVLFSLSNLEALAVPSHSGGIRSPSGSSNTEGSGLIDIRSMAAMTLGDGSSGETRRPTDALPTFSTPQFSPVAPVLLPMSTSGPPKWVYPVLGLLGVGILVLGYGILKVVTAPPPGQPPVIVAPAPAPTPVPSVVNPAPAAAPAPEVAKPAVPEEKPSAEANTPERGRGSSSRAERGHHRGSETASSKANSRKSAASTTPTSPAPSRPSAPASKPAGRKGSGSLDDLLGEVGNKRSGGETARPAVKLVNLTQSDIVSAMKGVQPKVQACANQFRVPGTAMANISVAAGGRVTSAKVTGKFAGTPTGSCVATAARSAKFPPCQSMTFPWPFTLSPR